MKRIAVSTTLCGIDWKDFAKRNNHFQWTAAERILTKVSLLLLTLDHVRALSSKEEDGMLWPIADNKRIEIVLVQIAEKHDLCLHEKGHTATLEKTYYIPTVSVR